MYKNAKAMSRMTANAAITPPAIAAVLELLTAPIPATALEVWEVEGSSLELAVGDVESSKEKVIESRIIEEEPSPVRPF